MPAILALIAIACDDNALQEPAAATSTAQLSPTTAQETLIITRTNASIGGFAGDAFGRVEATLFDIDGSARGTGSTTVRDGSWELQLFNEAANVETYPMPRERVEIRWLDMDVGASDADTVEIPELSYSFDADAGVIEGRVERETEGWGAKESVRAEIVIGRPEIATAVADVGADGAFSLDVGDGAGAGSASAVISLVSRDGTVRLVEDRRVPYIRVSLRPGDVTGAMAPLSDVELEIWGENGERRGTGLARSGPDGRFEAWVRDGSGERVRPRTGDRVIVGDGRDRRDWVLPEMNGRWDRESGELVGRGSPGNEIGILMWNPWHPGADGEPGAVVDADGAWSAQPPAPIMAATHYYITEIFPEGDELYLCYQIPMLHVEPGSAKVTVEALWEVKADLELRRDGQVIATAAGGGDWSGELDLLFEDTAGQLVAVASGDSIEGTLDGEPVSLPVAALEATIDADGMVVGAGPAGAEVGLASHSPIGERITVGDDGRFSLEAARRTIGGIAGIGGIGGSPRPGERLSVFTLHSSGNATHRRFVGPELEVRIDPPSVSGSIDPRGPAATLARVASDGTSSAIQIEPDATGQFEVTLDRPVVVPTSSDVEGGGEETESELERFELTQVGATAAITIPAFSAVVDPGGEALSGTGPPFGIIDIKAWIGNSVMPETLATFAKEDGTWSVPFGSGAPGRFTYALEEVSRFEVRLRLDPNALRLDLRGGSAEDG